MGFIETKEHLDQVVDYIEGLKGFEDYNSHVALSLWHEFKYGILVRKGIDMLAAEIGAKLTFVKDEGEFHDFDAYFEYRGYKFVQYCRNGDLDVNM